MQVKKTWACPKYFAIHGTLVYSDSFRVDGIIIETDHQEIYTFHEPILLNYIVLLIVPTSHNYAD